MKYRITKSTIGIAVVLATSIVYAAESKINGMMKNYMKGDASTYKKVATGKATDDDAKKLLEAVKELPACKPPKGDPGAWKTKTEALIKAVEDVVAKKPGAQAELQKAGNCKACHSDHKPPKA